MINLQFKLIIFYRFLRYTYLDSSLNGGRPVVVLKTKNIVPDHDQPVVINYKFNPKLVFVEPLMLVAAYFLLFILATVFSQNTSGKSQSKSET
jgi:hypothetical protein